MPSEWTLSMSGLRPWGNFCLIDVPVAEAGVVVFALAEPAIVHHEAVDAESGGLFGKRHLAGFSHVDFGGFPGVVDDGPRLGCGQRRPAPSGARQNAGELEVVEQARGAAQAVRRVAAVEDGRFERLAGMEDVAEVEGIEAAGDADGVELVLFDGDAPGAAPGQRAKPDFAVVLVGARRTE